MNKFALRAAVACVLVPLACFSVSAQEKIIKFGHLNNPDHPVSMGVKRFAELVGAKSGGKLKVQEFPASQLGNPVPMPFAELYGALEAKAVDGQENPFAVILSNKFFEVQKFVSATNHVYAANIVLVSKKFWDKLTPAEQKIMNDAANETRGYQRTQSRAAAQKAVADLQAKGMQYNDMKPAEQARMRQIAKPVTDKFAATYDPAIVKLYNAELARIGK